MSRPEQSYEDLALSIKVMAMEAYADGNLPRFFDLNRAAAVIEVFSDLVDKTALTAYGKSRETSGGEQLPPV
jgi:hypothetical protein